MAGPIQWRSNVNHGPPRIELAAAHRRAVLQGQGLVEISAQCIHAPIHRITGAAVVLHTHQTWAVTLKEGERLANLMGDKPIVFMKNPGHRD